MRFDEPRYPVDRYLVESSNKVEMDNIIEDIWNPEPTLRPEDEIILRKLHEMLQSTAEDLKLISGELTKHHERGVQIKTLPTPLDEEFNEKVHIEEVVNAKFHGNTIIDNSQYSPAFKRNEKPNATKTSICKSFVNACVQVDSIPTIKKPSNNKKLEMSRTKIMQITEKNQDKPKENRLNNVKINNSIAAVNYSEYSFEYIEPKEDATKNKLSIQKMPSINIRSELTEQKVLHLDILPETKEDDHSLTANSKIAFISIEHKPMVDNKPLTSHERQNRHVSGCKFTQGKTRKVSRLSTGDSSSTNVSSISKNIICKPVKTTLKSSPKSYKRKDRAEKTRMTTSHKPSDKKTQSNLELWKKKLNAVYGQTSSSRKNKTPIKNKVSSKQEDNPSKSPRNHVLNNKLEYIPYSQLTLGGVKVSDIERELADVPDKNEIPLTPLLDKILSSRENSLYENIPKNNKYNGHTKILTTSDENLLQEVIDIERSVSKTLSKNLKEYNKTDLQLPKTSNSSKDADSYADDFEDEKSDNSKNSAVQNSSDGILSIRESSDSENKDNDGDGKILKVIRGNDDNKIKSKSTAHNRTYIKKSNLSFKHKVDIFEFVHSVDTQDSGTQSTAFQKIALKETQTSPRNEKSHIEPIHNDLWPSIDSKGEVDQILKLEKDLIKKLIIDEYGDLLEKNITKASTSKELEDTQNNVVSFQKNTQTSPAHVKSVMTSPTRTKTRTTSPFTLAGPVDRHTSPMTCVTNEEVLRLEIENVDEDLGISINLSSPRFSLRLPQNSREVLSNLEESNDQTPSKTKTKTNKTFRKYSVSSSSSSVDADNSSSDISSLGEIKLRLRRRLRKCKVSSISDSSSSSVLSHCSSGLQTASILPLRSEGEVSIGQAMRKKLNKRDSDGEMSIRRLS